MAGTVVQDMRRKCDNSCIKECTAGHMAFAYVQNLYSYRKYADNLMFSDYSGVYGMFCML